jgi:hypothetical protein
MPEGLKNRLKRELVAEVVPSDGLIALHYPCLASMHPQRIGDQVETLMQVSGRIVNEELENLHRTPFGTEPPTKDRERCISGRWIHVCVRFFRGFDRNRFSCYHLD